MEDRDCPSTWTDATGDHQFGTADNWSDGMVPGSPGSGGMAAFSSWGDRRKWLLRGDERVAWHFRDRSTYTSRITLSGPVSTYMFGMSGGTPISSAGPT